MSSKGSKSAAAPKVGPDPLLPRTPIEIDGKTYDLCFTIGALAEAKSRLRKAGVEINLLQSINFSDMDADVIPPLFFAALLPFQPEMTQEKAYALVTLQTIVPIYQALANAYLRAWGTKDEVKNPGPPPGGPGK